MKINWKVRFKNPVFVAQLILAILMPIITYLGLNITDIVSWKILGEVLFQAISNPYVLGTVVVSVWNCINDPTTTGLGDSKRAQGYIEPAKDTE